MSELNPIPPPPPPPPPLFLPSASPSATPSPPPSTQQPLSTNPPPLNPSTTTTTTTTPHLESQTLAPKRQRRPSVRLGDIGGETTLDHSNFRRPKTSWRFHKDPNALKTSKTRPLTNLVNNKPSSFMDTFEYHTETTKPKSKKPIKRPRTNWTVPATAAPSNEFEFENDNDLGFNSPVNSRESLEFRGGARVSESSRGHPEMNGMEHNSGDGDEFRSSSVKDWLIGLGLARYAPVFEIHEVDDEVLPMLTLEDLKDMGINAVGSRRKMYTAIEKLQKEFL